MFVFVSLLLCMGSFINGGRASGFIEDANTTTARYCIDKERETLLNFKAGLVDINNTLNDWGDNTDCCQWEGVRCIDQTGHVTELDLSTSSNGLSGNISPLLSSLSNLQYLDLSGIDFQQNHIPNSLSSLTNLQNLRISGANLSGSIPRQLANLSNLLRLDLSDNVLSGTIPVSLGNLTSLTYLDLSGNRLEGVIPNSFGNWSSLVELVLSRNLLNGSVPNFVGCSSMKKLISNRSPAYNNRRFSDSVCRQRVTSFSGCPSLCKLDLSRNGLTGNLPNSMGKLSNLEYLDVSSNSLEGLISDVHFLNLTQLTYLDLSSNSVKLNLSSLALGGLRLQTIKMRSCKLGPGFPMWIQSQRDFAYLDISNNGISDRVPGWLWDLPRGLKLLNLSSNEIKGTLPDMKSDFERYPGMDLSNNQLEGTIPLLPSKLAALSLSGNSFSGTLSFLCHIDATLNFLDLSNNVLYGSLPDCLKKFQEIVVLSLSNNSLSGEIPSSLGFFSQLQALYLRRNNFVGEIPMSLSNCTKLRFVDLGENKLSGNIPAWIGETLSELRVLVLRSNRLNGSLPSQICLLKNLQFLDLSKNGLSGNIPRCFGNFTAITRRGFQDEIMSHFYSTYVPTLPGQHNLTTYNALNRSDGRIMCTRLGGRYSTCGPSEEAIFIDNALVAWKGTEREFGRGLHLLKSIDISNNNLYGKLPSEITNLRELVSLKFSFNKLHGEIPRDIGQLNYLDVLDLSRNEFSGKIPLSLSNIDRLSYLNLSYNNLSGRIPTGTQLQSFDNTSYIGNPQLCGLPLTQRCGPPPPPATDEGDELRKSYYMGMGVGFAVGFLGLCGALCLNRRWRYFFFASLNSMNDWIYVTTVVHFRKLHARFRR
ncbi:receptor-like protein EIX1 [Bidens hawaiensis]|uniref:receptor-like protein EIX1 n=1 Tax=Bidens hawaiensis TaxID=980011 RepID=UPI004049DDBA